MDVVRREVRQNPNITAVGSCCLVALVSNGTLYVANLGDSRAVIGRLDDVSNRIVAEQLTKDDNLRDQSIREALMREHSEEQDLVVEVNGAYRLKGKLQVHSLDFDDYFSWFRVSVMTLYLVVCYFLLIYKLILFSFTS